jgi:hypothetical protein
MSTVQTQNNEFTRDIVSRLISLRLKYMTVNLAIHLLMVLASLGVVWLAIAVIDYAFELPQDIRRIVAWTGAFLGVIGSLSLASWVAGSSNLKSVIRRLETRFADFGQRLRTVMDIHEGRFEVPGPMQRVLSNQTLARWETSAPSQLIPYSSLNRWLALAVFLFGFAGLSLFLGNEWSTALKRTLGADVPFTQLHVLPGNVHVIEGSNVQLVLGLEGRQGRKVMGKWRKLTSNESNGWIENELDATKQGSRAEYSIDLNRLKESVEYQFIE